MVVHGLERTALRGWLTALALFEVPQLHKYLLADGSFQGGFFSTLRNARPEKRVWSLVLALLVVCRVQAAIWPDSPGVLAHCAVVHVLEALVFGNEYLTHKGQGNAPIFTIIVVNALWFLSAACLLYTSPSPRDRTRSRMPSSA